MKTGLKSTDTRTGKRPGPVPKPKGIAFGYVNSMSECCPISDMEFYSCFDPTETLPQRKMYVEIEIKVNINGHTDRDQVRKEAKKAIDRYFKSL